MKTDLRDTNLINKPASKRNAQPTKRLCFFLLSQALACGIIFCSMAYASEMTASWYSIQSLKKEGTYKHSRGVMANGKKFEEETFTCATRIYPLGTKLKITNRINRKSVCVIVSDRIGKKFAQTRIDLSPIAFKAISGKQGLSEGLIKVKVERIK